MINDYDGDQKFQKWWDMNSNFKDEPLPQNLIVKYTSE